MSDDYDPSIFECRDEAEARFIVLTGSSQKESAQRWTKETPWFRSDIVRRLGVAEHSRILDYGVGLGRMAKQVIRFTGCQVVGVDISDSMRRLAIEHVEAPSFSAISPEALDQATHDGARFDGAYVLYVLQHCRTPKDDIARLKRALKPDGRLYVVNSVHRWVPTPGHGWRSDGQDVWKELLDQLDLIEEWPFPEKIATAPEVAEETRCAVFRNRA